MRLTKLHAIKPDSKTGLRGCTIPTAMVIISSIELLGFLLNPNGQVGSSKKNINFFFTFNNQVLFPDYYNNSALEKIWFYRHGMMHHFFPKFKSQFAGICKNEKESLLFLRHEIDGKLEESLNVTILTKDFLKAIKKLKIYLIDSSDEILFDTILKGLKDLKYYLKLLPVSTKQTTINPGVPKNK